MKICIIAEGCYPFIRGGLSEWAHMLTKALPDVDFDFLCITNTGKEKPLYEPWPNIKNVYMRPMLRAGGPVGKSSLPDAVSRNLAEALKSTLDGEAVDFETVVEIRRRYEVNRSWLASRSFWDFAVDYYRKNYADGSFIEYFWTLYGLYAIVIDNIQVITELPRADLYHTLSTGFAGMAGCMAKVLYNRPLIMTEQGIYMNERRDELSRMKVSEWYRQALMRFSMSIVQTSYKYADRIVPPCRSHIKMEKELGADPAKITFINNGIECERFVPGPPKQMNGSRPVVGCFARVVPIKGLTTLIKAAKIVNEKTPADFVVVGNVTQDEKYHAECRQLVKELGLEDCFRFTGYADALEWYHKCDVFTLSSISEGVPYALLEAMSCGIPVVCTSVGGMPEIVNDAGVGFIVPPNEPESLASRISELLENGELRRTFGQRGIQAARAKYQLSDMARNFRQLYQEMIDDYSRSQIAAAVS